MIPFKLSKNESIVFFELLSRFSDTDILNIEDESEKIILWNLCCQLETVLSEPLNGDWKEILRQARLSLKK